MAPFSFFTVENIEKKKSNKMKFDEKKTTLPEFCQKKKKKYKCNKQTS